MYVPQGGAGEREEVWGDAFPGHEAMLSRVGQWEWRGAGLREAKCNFIQLHRMFHPLGSSHVRVFQKSYDLDK